MVEHVADGETKIVANDTPQDAAQVHADESAAVPGALPNQAPYVIPDWYKVGWRQSSGIDDAPLPEGEQKDLSVLDLFISEQFYGEWYHNAAVIVFVRWPL